MESSRQLALFGCGGRVYAPYDQWEDYRAGMFDARITDEAVHQCKTLFRERSRCSLAMRRVIDAWPVASEVNLSNHSCNRRAWLGQAACCLACGATASATKRAWWQLSDMVRMQANSSADEVIALWESRR